jgi:hypothetical protein
MRGRFQPRAPDGSALKPRLLISAIACMLPAATMAGPKDGQVVAGQSTISRPDANTTATPSFGFGIGSATASARVDVSAGGLANLNTANGNLSFTQGLSNQNSAFAPDFIDADATTVVSAGDFIATASNGSIQLTGVLNSTGPGGGWSLQAGNNLNMNLDVGSSGARFDDALSLLAGTDVNINGDIFLADRSLVLTADTDSAVGGDVNIIGSLADARRVDTQGSINVSGANINLQDATLNAGQLQLMAATDVFGSSASVDAEGIYIAAGRDLHLFNTTTTVGNGTAPGVSGDPLVLDILEKAGIPLPANNAPNLKFQARGTMITGDIEVTASNAYLWFETDILSVGNMSAPAGPLTVQYSPFTPTLDIVFEDEPPPSEPLESPLLDRALDRPEQVAYFNSSHISSLPMTTLVLGGALQSGPMTVGANGPIDIGARNILLLNTPENVNSPDNIITTGIVATSGFVASLGREPDVFITPRLDSFEVETSTLWDEEERRKKQSVEAPEEEHGMCTAL